ncbi:MAG: PhzF family phenazine biosynthesis protein, partial [Acidobacteriales bacterium]|nr:PhzF family phenazine biosynthesis protein [Terriglobales bacterium]
RDSVRFETKGGPLSVSRDGELLAMDFPALPPWPSEKIPADLLNGLDPKPETVFQVKNNYFVIYSTEEDVRRARPNFALLEKLHPFGVGITAPGKDADFVSRYFVPGFGIPEDPVTGSLHCSLVPYWANVLKKTKFHARQLSARGGELWCEAKGDRVLLKGKAVMYMEGSISI